MTMFKALDIPTLWFIYKYDYIIIIIMLLLLLLLLLLLGLLDYDKNHNHGYFGQYCNHDYLTRLLAGHITKFIFYANLKYSVNSLL